ncbi:Lanthionine synthetase C-like protein [Nonomuraea solani]|uniref:Lanthionine synthetase C-like protein n=1 Tax=Nonomuraea solani TaxID=1144553 RepID=A0A1H6EWC4_9ACTN|nr:lanthionine synthetase C family protein [Nonomuraea solani]SEH01159.1 Lanthionine synthetase C-like protein [Nonomuraea solani]
MTRERAVRVAEEVAHRLADPADVEKAASAGTDRLLDGRTPLIWHAMSLNEGFLGVALLHAELGRREHAHAFLAAAAGTRPARHALSDGLPALLFATRAAAVKPGDYAGLLGRAEGAVREITRQRAETETAGLARLRQDGGGVTFGSYDVVEGLSGLGRLVLAYGDTEPLSYLIALTEPREVAGGTVPGWLVSHAPIRGGPDGDGHFNLGLAHGIPGPLALLAIAHREGVRLPGQEEAIERVADWLLGWTDGRSWPPTVTFHHELARTHTHALPPRPAWCYGTAGVARALFLAGTALDRPDWRRAAIRALRETLALPWDAWGMVDAGLCHGWAGMLHATYTVGRDSGDETLLAAADGLAGRIVAAYADDAPFGFRYSATGGVEVSPDRVGLLEGAAGIALALHHYGTGEPPVTGWDTALLMN